MNVPPYPVAHAQTNAHTGMWYNMPFTMFEHILQLPKKVRLIYAYINYNACAYYRTVGYFP